MIKLWNKTFEIPVIWFVTLQVQTFVLLLQNLVEHGGDVRTCEHRLHHVIQVRGLQQMTGYCLMARTGTRRKTRVSRGTSSGSPGWGSSSSFFFFYLTGLSSGIDVVAARLKIKGVDGEPSFGFFHLIGKGVQKENTITDQGDRKGKLKEIKRRANSHCDWIVFNWIGQNSGFLA